jgi:hypothetical protein
MIPGTVPNEKKSFFPQMSNFNYQLANLTVTALATCTTVIALETPLTSIVLNQLRSGKLLPRSSVAGRAGFFSLMSNLYAGVGAHAAGSFARAGYVTTAKQSALHPSATKVPTAVGIEGAHESVLEDKPSSRLFNRQFGMVASFALGNVIITHPFDTRRHLTTS